jgi:ATP-binding cassette, subfamily F, member 3
MAVLSTRISPFPFLLFSVTIRPMAIVLQLQEISKSFGPRRLFEAATVSVAEGQRIGLIGANGAGKTTLFKMVLGQEEVDSGTIDLHPKARLGYIEQQEIIPSEEKIIDYLVRVSGRESWECAKMAAAFEIKNEKLERTFGELSGGYQMRVRLAGVLVREPNLLLLDEPTNYLDLQTVLLLEDVLQNYRGALLLISHDREFLKNVCTHTLELEHQKLTLYPGDVEAYLEHKEQLLEETRRYNKKIQAQQKHLQTFVDRFRYKASLASQAQSKLKQIAKLKTIGIAHSLRTVRIVIPPPTEKKGTALACKELSIGYEASRPIVKNINLEMDRGEHIVVLAENGQGKSTLLKTLAGELTPLSGAFKWSHNIRLGYYAQHVPQMLPAHGTAGTYLSSVAGSVLPEEMLRMAGNFLFSKDDLEKPISILSGGERARLCLAGIFLGRYDTLLLDEPTNHLDFDTVEALGEALQEFPGTILFVSHSRTFVSQVATTILEVSQGRVRRYPHSYDVYVHELKTHETFVAPKEEVAQKENAAGYARRESDVFHDLQKEKRHLKNLEGTMQQLLEERTEILRGYSEHPEMQDIEKAKRLKAIDEESHISEAEWFTVHDRLEALEREMKTIKQGLS